MYRRKMKLVKKFLRLFSLCCGGKKLAPPQAEVQVLPLLCCIDCCIDSFTAQRYLQESKSTASTATTPSPSGAATDVEVKPQAQPHQEVHVCSRGLPLLLSCPIRVQFFHHRRAIPPPQLEPQCRFSCKKQPYPYPNRS